MSSAGSRSSGSSSSRTEASIHSVRVLARDRCAAWKVIASAGIRPRAGDVHRVAGGRVGDGRVLRLGLVEQRERAAARPAAEHDLLVAPCLLRGADPGADVEQDLFEDQRRIVLRIAAPRAQNVDAVCRQGPGHRQELEGGGRMHEEHQRLRLAAPGRVVHALEVHVAGRPGESVGLGEPGHFAILHVPPGGFGFEPGFRHVVPSLRYSVAARFDRLAGDVSSVA